MSTSDNPEPTDSATDKRIHWVACAFKDEVDKYLPGSIFENSACCDTPVMLSPDGQNHRRQLRSQGHTVNLVCLPCMRRQRREQGDLSPVNMVHGAEESIARVENRSPAQIRAELTWWLRNWERHTE